MKMIKYSRNYAAGATGRCGDNLSSRCILFTHGKSICIQQPPALKAIIVTGSMNIITHSLTTDSKTAGKHPFGLNASQHSLLHHSPHLIKIVPHIRILALIDIFPITLARLLTPPQNILDGVHIIDVSLGLTCLPFLKYVTSAYTVERLFDIRLTVKVKCLELHSVRMKRQKYIRLPYYLTWRILGQFVKDSLIGHMPLACSSQRSVKSHTARTGIRRHIHEFLSSLQWSHGMAA